MGAVERLGQRSGPTPEAELLPGHLNVAHAASRRGKLYERASSRQSREKAALEHQGDLSRDIAVPLGNSRQQHKRIFQADTMDEVAAQQGQKRAMTIALAHVRKQPRLRAAANPPKPVAAAKTAKPAKTVTAQRSALIRQHPPLATVPKHRPRPTKVSPPPPPTRRQQARVETTRPPSRTPKTNGSGTTCDDAIDLCD